MRMEERKEGTCLFDNTIIDTHYFQLVIDDRSA